MKRLRALRRKWKRRKWGEAVDRMRAYAMTWRVLDQLHETNVSTFECPNCGQPCPHAYFDSGAQLLIVCAYCGKDWFTDTPQWMIDNAATE